MLDTRILTYIIMEESTSPVFQDFVVLKSGNIFLDLYVANLYNAKYAKSMKVR